MKRLMSLLQYVLDESGTWCRTSTDRDLKTIMARVENEGDEFLTITLPQFGKDFEKSLDQGKVDPSLFLSFKKKGELPVFLGGFLDHVFDRETGVLRDPFSTLNFMQAEMLADEYSVFLNSIRAIRQITLMFGKINEPCSPSRERRAILNYLLCEEEIRANDATFLRGLQGVKPEEFSDNELIALRNSLLPGFERNLWGKYSSAYFVGRYF
jgi:hypothetical protein